jgi:hypothetical protein
LQIKWIGLILEEDGLVTCISEEVPVSEGDEAKALHKKISSNLDRYESSRYVSIFVHD